MDCEAVRERFLALEEGFLGGAEAAALRAHIAECEDCRAAWERWRADDRLLWEALGPVAAPRDFAAEAVARIRAGGARRRVAVPMGLLRWAIAGAAAACVMIGIWMVLAPRREEMGRVEAVEGQAMVRHRGSRFARAVETGATIYNGDQLMSGEDSRLTVRLLDGSLVALEPRTEVCLHGSWSGRRRECGFRLPHVCLREGGVGCQLRTTRHIRGVGTPLGSAIVRGTRFKMRYVVGVKATLEVYEGEVVFSCPNGEALAKAGTVWEVRARELVPRQVSGPGQ